MKNLFTIIVIVLVGYFGWQKIFNGSHSIEGLYEEPYVVVYGRDSCGWTDKYLKDLKREGIDLIYVICQIPVGLFAELQIIRFGVFFDVLPN